MDPNSLITSADSSSMGVPQQWVGLTVDEALKGPARLWNPEIASAILPELEIRQMVSSLKKRWNSGLGTALSTCWGQCTSCGGHGPCCLPAPRSRLSGHRYTCKMHYPVEVQLSPLSQCNKTSLVSNYTLFSIFLLNIPLFPFELVLASVHSLMSNKIFNVSISIWATRFHPFWKISFNRSRAHNEIPNRFTCQSQVNTVHGEVCLVCS